MEKLDSKKFAIFLQTCILGLLPIIQWLPKYNLRNNLHCDVLTGLTVGIMVVPQAMAYATLAGVAPVNGLYACFFSAFFYMFFGTSRHISIGTFAVASMMVGSVVAEFFPDQVANNATLNNETQSNSNFDNITPLVITSALTFWVGILQLLMALFRLSFLTIYISDPLVSGFTTGAAVHVLTSQLDKLIGVKVPHRSGAGFILLMWHDLVLKIMEANWWTVAISIFGLAFLGIGRDYVNPWFRRRYNVPLPFELILVILSILVSSLCKLNENNYVKIVGQVPDGLPFPSLPRWHLLPLLWTHAVPLALICYVFVISLEKIFAKKHRLALRPNQELMALGLSSVLASLFPVYPFGASIARSSLCELMDAKTMLHALFSSGLLLAVILWIGPLLQPLPMAILACIVAISLKPVFLQYRILSRLWRINKYDFFIWLIACVATILLDITYGLIISVIFSIFTVVLREQWPTFKELDTNLEENGGTEQLKQELSSNEKMNIQIWRFQSPLHFANVSKFSEQLQAIIINKSDDNSANYLILESKILILDCSAISHIDSMGVDSVVEVYKDAETQGWKIIFAKFPDAIIAVLKRCDVIGPIIPIENFYPSTNKFNP